MVGMLLCDDEQGREGGKGGGKGERTETSHRTLTPVDARIP
jgi:hypothetical protein